MGKGERILLVEDEEQVLNATRQLLDSLGYEVTSTNSPHAALQLMVFGDA